MLFLGQFLPSNFSSHSFVNKSRLLNNDSSTFSNLFSKFIIVLEFGNHESSKTENLKPAANGERSALADSKADSSTEIKTRENRNSEL